MIKDDFSIVVVGAGFVGKAVIDGFRNVTLAVDPRLGTKLSDMKVKPNAIFICVPTPMGANGDIDASIVESVLEQCQHSGALMVLKSTVSPNLVKGFAEKYKRFVYNPEFLTERNAAWDFTHPISNVFGGDPEDTKELEQIYIDYSYCEPAETFHMTAEEASFVKYSVNSYLTTKVLFFNQLYKMTEAAGVDFEKIRLAITNDDRIGPKHTMVPGNDGRLGAAGACFSKDIPAFIRYSQKIKQEFSILKQVWNTNCELRNSYKQMLPREVEQHISFTKI
jgi:UDPglucose 6-dehydrogenase